MNALPSAVAGRAPERQPSAWLLLGDKRGDNAQIEIIADALNWGFVRKSLVMKPEWVLGKPKVGPSLDHVDLDRSDRL